MQSRSTPDDSAVIQVPGMPDMRLLVHPVVSPPRAETLPPEVVAYIYSCCVTPIGDGHTGIDGEPGGYPEGWAARRRGSKVSVEGVPASGHTLRI